MLTTVIGKDFIECQGLELEVGWVWGVGLFSLWLPPLECSSFKGRDFAAPSTSVPTMMHDLISSL